MKSVNQHVKKEVQDFQDIVHSQGFVDVIVPFWFREII